MLTTIGLALGTAAAAALGRAHWNRKLALDSLGEMTDAVEVGTRLLELIGHLQQHRGMSTALLSGDASYQPRLAAKRAEVEGCLATLGGAFSRESDRSHPCFTKHDLTLVRFKWQALSDGLGQLSPESSIAQHTQLVAQVLDWLANYGEARIELPAGELLSPGIVRNVCHRLPALAETLGQARALGMGVAASGACKPVARVRLMFLTTRAESLLQQSTAATEIGSSGDVARIRVQEMIKVVRCDMLGVQFVTLPTHDYFGVATAAIDAVFEWIDAGVDGIGTQLAAARACTAVVPPRQAEKMQRPVP